MYRVLRQSVSVMEAVETEVWLERLASRWPSEVVCLLEQVFPALRLALPANQRRVFHQWPQEEESRLH